MKKILKITASIVLILVLASGVFLFYLSRGLDQDMQLTGIDISDMDDGVYQGSYEGGRWTNILSVTIIDNRITDIGIVDDVTFSKSEVSTALFESVENSQSTAVNMISGATVTSMAYLKSIEDAVSNN